MQFGLFDLSIIRECTFRLDGGAMFGVVPKPLWDALSPADELNRIALACNLLLIKTPVGNVLVETGMGQRWQTKEIDRYAVKTLVDYENVVASARLTNADINHVVISHLHFDHAGGACRQINEKIVPTYPNAVYYTQQGEWDLANKPNGRAKASYRQEDFLPLKESGQLKILNGDSQIVPGVFARVTGGHTKCHQVVTFDSQGNHGVYFADIMPTAAHLSPPWVMGYDHFPLDTCDVKSKYLAQAADERWLVVFDHELSVPWGYVEIGQDGKFKFSPLKDSQVTALA